jgi:hypothetical protein
MFSRSLPAIITSVMQSAMLNGAKRDGEKRAQT